MRFIWAALLDKFSYRSVYGVLLSLQITLGVTFPFIVQNKYCVGVWVCLGFFTLGGHFSMLPNEVRKVFGPHSTELYTYMFSMAGLTGLTEGLLQIYLMNAQNLNIFFYVYSGSSFLSLLILLVFYRGNVYISPANMQSWLANC